MQILLIHQNFPAQFKLLAQKLLKTRGNRVAAIAQSSNFARVDKSQFPGLRYIVYEGQVPKLGVPGDLKRSLDHDIRHGEMAAAAAEKLKNEGFRPDIVFVHPGWGEGLFLKHVFPDAKHLHYLESPLHDFGVDTDFDPEFPIEWRERRFRHLRNATQFLSLRHADRFVSPTNWQLAQYPEAFRAQAQVIFDGIDTGRLAGTQPKAIRLPDGALVKPGEELVTYVARGLEPYRGFHVFMRALPEILKQRPQARALIVGTDRPFYHNRLKPGESWKRLLLAELGDSLPVERVHFLERLPYDQYVAVLRISSAHVYLTYPFVPSWSLFEALAAGCLVVASATEPVKEVISDGENGRLVDFFDRAGLVERVVAALADPKGHEPLRRRAMQRAQERYDFERTSWPRYRRLFDDLRVA